MRAEIAIAKYTLMDLVLVEAAAAPSVLVISERVRGVAAKRVPLWPRVLL